MSCFSAIVEMYKICVIFWSAELFKISKEQINEHVQRKIIYGPNDLTNDYFGRSHVPWNPWDSSYQILKILNMGSISFDKHDMPILDSNSIQGIPPHTHPTPTPKPFCVKWSSVCLNLEVPLEKTALNTWRYALPNNSNVMFGHALWHIVQNPIKRMFKAVAPVELEFPIVFFRTSIVLSIRSARW